MSIATIDLGTLTVRLALAAGEEFQRFVPPTGTAFHAVTIAVGIANPNRTDTKDPVRIHAVEATWADKPGEFTYHAIGRYEKDGEPVGDAQRWPAPATHLPASVREALIRAVREALDARVKALQKAHQAVLPETIVRSSELDPPGLAEPLPETAT